MFTKFCICLVGFNLCLAIFLFFYFFLREVIENGWTELAFWELLITGSNLIIQIICFIAVLELNLQ